MENYKKILTVIDPTTDDQKALKRSIELARRTGGEITAFLTIYDFSYEMTTMLSGEEREAMRQSMINDRMQWLEEKIAEIDDAPRAVTRSVSCSATAANRLLARTNSVRSNTRATAKCTAVTWVMEKAPRSWRCRFDVVELYSEVPRVDTWCMSNRSLQSARVRATARAASSEAILDSLIPVRTSVTLNWILVYFASKGVG